jgi:hypothetical protein
MNSYQPIGHKSYQCIKKETRTKGALNNMELNYTIGEAAKHKVYVAIDDLQAISQAFQFKLEVLFLDKDGLFVQYEGLTKCHTLSCNFYHRICTCAKPSTRSQSCVTIGSFYHCHLSRYFPHFSDGRRSNTREASLVTSRDQIARLVEPTTPILVT